VSENLASDQGLLAPAKLVAPKSTDVTSWIHARSARVCDSLSSNEDESTDESARWYRAKNLLRVRRCRKHSEIAVIKVFEFLVAFCISLTAAETIHFSYVAGLERRVQELSARLESTKGNTAADAPSAHIERQHTGILAAASRKDRRPATQYSASIGTTLVPESSVSRHDQKNTADGDHGPSSDHDSMHETGGELRDINEHTKSIEFHGNTSSMSFLALVQNQDQNATDTNLPHPHPEQQKSSLVSTLHNTAFHLDPQMHPSTGDVTLEDECYYFRHSRLFLDAYFDSLHFIHPILERDEFLARCEDLWFGRSEKQTRSFVALYYSVLSLGALIRSWDESLLAGLNRFQWSRKLFTHAKLALGEVRSTNDLETIQCLIFMAKVCQNELNPHLAYMYLGMAVRASLSAGYHRESVSKGGICTPTDTATAISKTWWGLYSLEIEMSFSLGRPDSLGLEEHHNRRHPPIVDSETAILPIMIPFAHITRRVSVAMYLSKASMREKISWTDEIESQMDVWLSTLPEKIRPGATRENDSFRILKDPKWARRQRLVLQIRYWNVKMVLYRPCLIYASQNAQRLPVVLEATVAKCVDAARNTIEIMHETFRHHVFFRTWWYNTTYILYAASIILCYATRVASSPEKPDLFRLIDMTVEIFEAMEECFVARKAGEMIKQSLSNARKQAATLQTSSAQQRTTSQDFVQQPGIDTEMDINTMLNSQMELLPMDTMFDFDDPDFAFTMDGSQFICQDLDIYGR
jgi:hypothetical protein